MKSDLTQDQRIEAAYQWLTTYDNSSLNQASMRFHVSDVILRKELKQRYGYSATKAFEERRQRHFDELCKLWPKIKHELDTTEDRALVIINRYGHGQNSLNALVEYYQYDITSRANRIRQAKRARTLESRKPQPVKSDIDELRYRVICKPWSNAA